MNDLLREALQNPLVHLVFPSNQCGLRDAKLKRVKVFHCLLLEAFHLVDHLRFYARLQGNVLVAL